MDDPELFEAVMERPEPQREQAVREACADDPERVERMLGLVRLASEHETISCDGPPADELGPRVAKGDRIDRYVVISRLGEGAFGEVHEVFDLELERRVALKMLHPERDATPEDERRFRREALALAQIDHPNVVKIWDVGVHEGRRFITMELVEGTSLRPFVAGGHSWREILQTLLPAAHGLRAAHEAGIVHRDFKPENVLLHPDGRVVVTDFGIARVMAADTSRDATTGALRGAGPASSTRSAAGSPRYMAPEQRLGEASPASDQFAFCRVICEALGSKMGPEPLSDVDGPRWLRRILARGRSREPEDRFPDLGTLIARIEAHLDRRRWAARGAAAVALTVPLAAAYITTQPEPCDRWDGATDELEPAWAALSDASSRHPAPEAAAAQMASVRMLSEQSARRWIRGRTETCRLRASGMLDEPTAQARDRCLSHWWDELRQRLEWTAQQPEALVDPELLAALPRDPLRCLHAEPEGVFGPPLPPGVEERIERSLTEATDLRLLGDFDGSEQRVRDALRLAERAEHDGYRATTLHRLGVLAARVRRPELALTMLQDSLRVAEGRGLDGRSAEILADLTETLALHPEQRAAEAEPLLALARAKVERDGGRFDELSATLDVVEGHVAMQLRDLERAAAAYGRGAERFESAYGLVDFRTAAARAQLARAMSLQGRTQEAAELAGEALAHRIEVLGARHPLVIEEHRQLGILHMQAYAAETDPEVKRDRLRAAASSFESAATLARETLGPGSLLEARALVELVTARAWLGEIDESVAQQLSTLVDVYDDPTNREITPAARDRALRAARNVHHQLRNWDEAWRLATRLVELHTEPVAVLDPQRRDDELALVSYEIQHERYDQARRRLEANERTYLAVFEGDDVYRSKLDALWKALPDLPSPREGPP